MRLANLIEKVEFPGSVQAHLEGTTLRLKGPKGELHRDFKIPQVELKIEGNKVVISSKNATRVQKMMIGTAKSHIKNMVVGVTEGYVYKLKICSGHFPMNASVSGDTFVIKNFLGEKIPRTVKIKEGAKVKVDGAFVIVEGIDLEKVAQAAADIELLTRITKRDIRIFQDGIYIVEKAGKPLA